MGLDSLFRKALIITPEKRTVPPGDTLKDSITFQAKV
jgi:hypothetical protein